MEPETFVWICVMCLVITLVMLTARDVILGKPILGQRKQVAPKWMFPAGIAAIAIGVLGCWGSAVGERGAPTEVFAAAVLVSMITNPLVVVGIPLGCYWLYRSAKGSERGNKRGPSRATMAPSGEDNPKLTHCPDCGGHVSRLAASCPHCSRPLIPEENNS
jgi:hypothetical protein